ncbi:hypothetical protein [Mesorhizobium sp. M1322]|uniref:hypothetical protein n=1 Tax=Mesorhizobium sp. M1322 TaxID=2957081 RepID=UPI00333AB7C1
MSTTASSAISAMRALRAEIEGRLLHNEDYRAFMALNKAIDEVSPPIRSEIASEPHSEIGRVMKRIGEELFSKVPSQPEAAGRILSDYGPTTTADILEMIKEFGVTVSGNDPLINLSSSLSKSGHFRSIRINGVPHWWFKDRPLPSASSKEAIGTGSLEFGGLTDAGASAADSGSSDGGSDDAAA